MNVRHLAVIGPAEPALAKVKDLYRKVLYIKHRDYQVLVDVKNCVEEWLRDDETREINSGINVFFDFNPMNMY